MPNAQQEGYRTSIPTNGKVACYAVLLAASDNSPAAAFNHAGTHVEAIGTGGLIAHPFTSEFHVRGTIEGLLVTPAGCSVCRLAGLQFVVAGLDLCCDSGRFHAVEVDDLNRVQKLF